MASFRCDILTPYRRLFEGEVESLLFVTHDGQMVVMAGHEPVVAPIKTCVLKVRGPEGLKFAAAAEGFATITASRVELFLDAAEWSHEIDPHRASEALARAEKRLGEGSVSWETSRAEAAAARARARLGAIAQAAEARKAG